MQEAERARKVGIQLRDPLSQDRGGQTTLKSASQIMKLGTGKKPYEAFDTAGKLVPYMEILCATQPSQSPQSRFFMAAVFSADDDASFTLIYSYMAVEIRGSNLGEIRRAVQNSRCEFIQEFNDHVFLRPDRPAPIIESIRFITGDKLDDILATYKASR